MNAVNGLRRLSTATSMTRLIPLRQLQLRSPTEVVGTVIHFSLLVVLDVAHLLPLVTLDASQSSTTATNRSAKIRCTEIRRLHRLCRRHRGSLSYSEKHATSRSRGYDGRKRLPHSSLATPQRHSRWASRITRTVKQRREKGKLDRILSSDVVDSPKRGGITTMVMRIVPCRASGRSASICRQLTLKARPAQIA